MFTLHTQYVLLESEKMALKWTFFYILNYFFVYNICLHNLFTFFQMLVPPDPLQSLGHLAIVPWGPILHFKPMPALLLMLRGIAWMGLHVLLSKLQNLSYTIASKFFLFTIHFSVKLDYLLSAVCLHFLGTWICFYRQNQVRTSTSKVFIVVLRKISWFELVPRDYRINCQIFVPTF